MVHVLEAERIVDAHDGGAVWGVVSGVNPLKSGFPEPTAPRVIAWSGWAGDAAAESAERDFWVWGPAAWDQLRVALREAVPAYEAARTRLVLRPHARHVVSDAQRWVKLREEFPGVGLLLDPVPLFSEEMVSRAEDHLGRLAAALAPGSDGVLISDAAPGVDGMLAPVEWGRGVLPREALIRLAGPCRGAVIVRRGDAGAGSALGREEA
jgi:hypothetical protein